MKSEEWARQAADILKAKMTAEEIEVIKNDKRISIPVAGPIRQIRTNYNSYLKSQIIAENAAHKVLNDYYTDLIRKYL